MPNPASHPPMRDALSPPNAPTRRTHRLRRRLVACCFRRLLRSTDEQLCEPDQLPVRGIHRVLVCRPNHRLGNTLLISPLLAEIETLYPGAEIDLVSAGCAARNLFTRRFQVRTVYSLPRKIARHLWATIDLLRQVRSDTYDLAIDACNDSQSGRLLLAIAKARFKLGYPGEQSGRKSAWRDFPCPVHLAHRGVFLLRTAYAGKTEQAWPPLNLRLSDDEKMQAREALKAVLGGPGRSPGKQPVIGMFANATGTKRYPTDWWKQFIDCLQTLRPDICIVDLVAEHGQSQLGNHFASYYTRDLRRLAAVIANMDGFISADCGVMHLAVASGTPTLGLFSTTCSGKYGPYGTNHTAVDTRPLGAADVATIAADWLALRC
ncbi:glycosyltransferase family 9 protein [Rhodanobacter geophilus]|uniref:Glycosyltransferase family 9 protein n=1 Tax=Rhodanobacter geophilus TaxID=3162488 RepID=A0ABV3QM68_9GAMM